MRGGEHVLSWRFFVCVHVVSLRFLFLAGADTGARRCACGEYRGQKSFSAAGIVSVLLVGSELTQY
jgi:hypothetical protein